MYELELYPKEIFLFLVVTISECISYTLFLKHSMGKTNVAPSSAGHKFLVHRSDPEHVSLHPACFALITSPFDHQKLQTLIATPS